MKPQMKREANESGRSFDTERLADGALPRSGLILTGFTPHRGVRRVKKCFRMKKSVDVGA